VSGTSLYESWVYTGFNFILGLPIIFYGILDRDLSEDFVLKWPQVRHMLLLHFVVLCVRNQRLPLASECSPHSCFGFLQTYSTGRTNVALTTSALGVWILNAILYAIMICLIFYYAVAPTFEEMGLYVAGTTFFVGLCMSLQAKVAFFHHQWAWPQVLMMVISIVGMFLYFLMISASFNDYYYVAQTVYSSGIFWLFGMFFMPIVAIYIDWIGYYCKMLFWPTREMLYREFEHADEFNDVQQLRCLSGRVSQLPLVGNRGKSLSTPASDEHELVDRASRSIRLDDVYPDSGGDSPSEKARSQIGAGPRGSFRVGNSKPLHVVDL
jgi:hypothetical protein